jgi:anti-sigma factor RsiW
LSTPDEKITCREFVELMDLYHDGILPASQSRSFESHLGRCPRCREYLNSYEATVRSAHAAMKPAEDRTADSIPEDLVKKILDERPRRK